MGRRDKTIQMDNPETLSAGARLRRARQSKKLSLTSMSERLKYSKSYLSKIENGYIQPPQELIDKYQIALAALKQDEPTHIEQEQEELRPRPLTKEDRGEAPVITNFYGREQELADLQYWIVNEGSQMVLVHGIGGIGKTMLTSSLMDQIKGNFEYVFWRSLQNAPPIENILKSCIQFLSDHKQTSLPEHLNQQILMLIENLRSHRCLVILDNVESVLGSGEHAGQYREGYEGYGTLIQLLGETKHKSCLMMTSREKLRELLLLEEHTVRSMQLRGLELLEAQAILKNKHLFGSNQTWEKFIQFYGGNPLALKLVSEPIREMFQGDISAFLDGEEGIVGDVDWLLSKQFSRLSEQEQEIMYWLANERDVVSLESLREDTVSLASKRHLIESLSSLRRRSMIENDNALYFLQPVIMEFVTNKFIEHVYEEISTESVKLLSSHVLMKAQTKEYIRLNQVRFILKPLVDRLLAEPGKKICEGKIENILTAQRKKSSQMNYVTGNMLNLLIQLGVDLNSYNFSHLVIQQAYLQRVSLHRVSFAHAQIEKSVFTDTFGSIFSVALSSDGQFLAAGMADGDIRLWDTDSTTPMGTCKGHTDWVRSVAFHPDSQQNIIASGGEDQTVRLWDTNTGNCLKIFQGHESRIYSVAFNPDGNTIASGSHDQTIRLWDVKTGNCFKVLRGHKGRVYSVAFNSDGNIIASGGEDQTIRLWDVTGNCFKILRGHTDRVRSVAFSPTGNTLASGSEDRTVKLWDTTMDQCSKTLRIHTNRVWSVAFNPDGDMVASGSDDQTLRLWNTDTGECIRTLEGRGSRVYSIAFAPREKNMIISGSDHQTIRLWDTRTGVCIRTLQGYGGRIYSVAFSPDSERLVSGSEDQTIRFWDAKTNRCLKLLQGHTHWVWSVAFSSNGQVLASGSEDWTTRLWDANTGESIKVLQDHSYRVYSVAFNPVGNMLASGSTDQMVKLWDLSTGICVKTLIGHHNRIKSVGFNLEGNILASGSDDKTIKLWDPTSGKCLNTLSGHSNKVSSVAFSPDGKILASSSDDKTIKLWDPISGRCLNTLSGHSSKVSSVAFSPDGKILASGSDDKTIRLWNSSTGENYQVLHGNVVYSVAFNHDGKMLASGGPNGVIEVWDLQTNKSLQPLKSDRPYEGMNIFGMQGLKADQKATLIALGAIEEDVP